MRLLFDASAVLNSVRRYGEGIVELVEGGECYALSLTQYEVGNALWKEACLLKRISAEEALKALEFVSSLLSLMRVVDVSGRERKAEALSMAVRTGLTFYDASYLLVARDLGCSLVTDDEEVVEASKGLGVRALRSSDLPIEGPRP